MMSDDETTATLASDLCRTAPGVAVDPLPPHRLDVRSRHRKRFWERACLDFGLSAGILESLETSAIVLIKLSLNALLGNFSTTCGGRWTLRGPLQTRCFVIAGTASSNS